MESVVQPPADVELQLLTEWGDAYGRTRTRQAGVYSVLVHVALIGILSALPESLSEPPKAEPARHVTPLVFPPELTQKDPTKGKINREFDVRTIEPRPNIQIPQGPPSTTRPRAMQPPQAPAVAASRPTAPPPGLPEPPKVEQPKVETPQIAQVPPPQIQPVEKPVDKPKSPFETPTAPPVVPKGQSQVPIPSTSIADTIRQGMRGSSGGGVTVGDMGDSGPGGYGEAAHLPPSPGNSGSQLQLLSDPQGVDFRPYLIRVLTSVRQHWMAVIPQSVGMGRRGKVSIQFAISRDGGVPKMVIATPSGADALDRAAIAGISASVPFPNFPTEFKGDRIVLQFNFAYNMK